MSTLYHFVDESYRESNGYWHCSIGGALVLADRVVRTELALQRIVYSLVVEHGHPYSQGEFKYTNFFRDTPDEFKLVVARDLAEALRELGIRFVVSHAKIQSSKLPALGGFAPPAQEIQQLAYINVDASLAPLRENHLIQRVVDLGLQESFRPIYEIYVSQIRGIGMLKARDIPDENITIKNYENLPVPLFLDSRDSRLLQFSDVVIGLLLARETDELTPFKREWLAALDPILPLVELHSVEWNKG